MSAPKKPGPEPQRLKIDLPPEEAVRRLVKAKPKPKKSEGKKD